MKSALNQVKLLCFICISGFCVCENLSSAPEQVVGVGDKEELFIESGEGGATNAKQTFTNNYLMIWNKLLFNIKLDHLTTSRTIQRKGSHLSKKEEPSFILVIMWISYHVSFALLKKANKTRVSENPVLVGLIASVVRRHLCAIVGEKAWGAQRVWRPCDDSAKSNLTILDQIPPNLSTSFR